jgi:starch phosphorylase
MTPSSPLSGLTVAYFTMEVGLRSDMPTFAGGLGILAADILRSCADARVPSCGVTMCWQHGYLRQRIRPDGTQEYADVQWNPADILRKLPNVVPVTVEGRTVHVGAWMLELHHEDFAVPVFFLDTDLPQNAPEDRAITNHLYGGDQAMRIKQEIVLGIGGVRMLRSLGHADIGTYHMNEGHAAFLTLELLRERNFVDADVRRSCAFTTHTPVQAGHDVFPYDLAWRIAGDQLPWHIKQLAGEGALSMTTLAMTLSRFTCGVSRIHGEVSRRMFPGNDVGFITNGIHHVRWASPEMQALFDKHIPGWREDPSLFTAQSKNLPDTELWGAHQGAKRRLVAAVNERGGQFDPDHLLIASARRVVPYKRPELLYTNLMRLKEVACGRIQIVHAGNAHPSDAFSQEVIRRMVERSAELRDCVRIAYLDNYNPDLAQLLVSGADVWLNTPTRLMEASGTSGMKACVNGVLNLSTLDGWWIEGYERDPEAGWRIGPMALNIDPATNDHIDAEDLYTQLQYEVIPEYYYADRVRWLRRMKRAIGLIGFFNTARCVGEYVGKAWHDRKKNQES